MSIRPVALVLALAAPLVPVGAFDNQPASPRPAPGAEAPAAPVQAGHPAPAPVARPASAPRAAGQPAPAPPVAQPAPGQPAPGQPAPARPRPPKAEPPEAPQAPAPPRKPPLPINVRVDIVVTEQMPGWAPIVRRAQLATADGEFTSVRNHSVWRLEHGRQDEAPFRIDLQADVLDDARVRLRVGVDYGLARPDDTVNGGQVTIRQVVIVRDGQPVVIAETSDPVTERVVRIEAKANIVK